MGHLAEINSGKHSLRTFVGNLETLVGFAIRGGCFEKTWQVQKDRVGSDKGILPMQKIYVPQSFLQGRIGIDISKFQVN